MSLMSAAVLLFLVMDPLGNIPTFLSLLSGLEPRRARRILLRELLIALAVLIVFLLLGRSILQLLQITEPALSVSGGVILFLIALKMIFEDVQDIFGKSLGGEPFVVPLAVPLIAGPSALATVLLLIARQPARWPTWLAAIVLAWFASGLILYFASFFGRVLGKRGTAAIQVLAGMLLTTMAVQMFLTGVRQFFS